MSVSNRTVVRKPANHALHLILTLLTLGMWSPVWAVCAAIGRRETVTQYPAYQPVWNPYTGRWQ